MLRVAALILGLFALSYGPALSETYYVAPLGAVISGTPDGTEKQPFASIDKAFASGKVKGGDTLLLKDGAYGAVEIKANATFDVPVIIMSKNGKAAQFDSILLAQDTRNITLRNLSIWPRNPAISSAYLIRSYTTVSNITVDSLDIRSEETAADFMTWGAEKWQARKFHGIVLEGKGNLAIRNKVVGIYDGIFVGEHSQIIDNIVDGFNGDGLRAISHTTVRGNKVMNCVKTDDNHDDGFQSFASNGGSISDLVLDRNVIIEWTGAANHPLRCTLQGIGLFGGPYVNLTVVNNVISVAHSHGISIYGAKGALVVNNTVVNIFGTSATVPYIAVRPHSDGTPSTDVLAANNVAMSFDGRASASDRVVFRNNSVIGIPSLVFENPAAFDYRPKASSGFIDMGDATVAPATDVLGQNRPSGPLPDRGAYEVQIVGAPTPVPVVPIVDPVPVVPIVDPAPIGPKRIKVTIDDLRKGPPVSKRRTQTSGSAKRIILEW
jgi:hypothetical protein